MTQAKKPNRKMILWIVLPSIFLVAMLGLKFLVVQADINNQKEIEAAIEKQQALRTEVNRQKAASAVEAQANGNSNDRAAENK